MFLTGVFISVLAIIFALMLIKAAYFNTERTTKMQRGIYILIAVVLLGLALAIFMLPRSTKITATNGDVIEFETEFVMESGMFYQRWEKVELDKKQYDIGDGLVYEHIAAYTDGKRVIRCALINYFPSQIPQSQLEAARNSLAYLFTEAGETYTGAVSEETEERLNTYFANYMNNYLTTPEAAEVGQITLGDGTKKPLYKYVVQERIRTEPYFEMYYCLYSDTKILAFFVNSGNELADITSGSTQSNMDAALANEEIISLLSQENVEAAILSEDLFRVYMDNLITKIGGLPVLCGKDFTSDTDGMILTFAKSTRIIDSGNKLTLVNSDAVPESISSDEASTQSQ